MRPGVGARLWRALPAASWPQQTTPDGPHQKKAKTAPETVRTWRWRHSGFPQNRAFKIRGGFMLFWCQSPRFFWSCLARSPYGLGTLALLLLDVDAHPCLVRHLNRKSTHHKFFW